jgi:hypothetical protein
MAAPSAKSRWVLLNPELWLVVCSLAFFMAFQYRLWKLVDHHQDHHSELRQLLPTSAFVDANHKDKSIANDFTEPDQIARARRAMKMRPGVLVLGMHHSGASMITGTLVRGCHFDAGDKLSQPRDANTKGLFENADMVKQNDLWIGLHNVTVYKPSDHQATYLERIMSYRPTGAAQLSGSGKRLINFVKTAKKPWIINDPRICITLVKWLSVFPEEPATLFVYRHPLEAVQSIMNAQRNPTTIYHALGLWMTFNRLAIENSRGRCRVIAYYNDLVEDPIQTIAKITMELCSKCGVSPPAHVTPSQTILDEFVRVELQQRKDLPGCEAGDVHAASLRANVPTIQNQHRYQQAIKFFCDMQSNRAFQKDYDDWPVL